MKRKIPITPAIVVLLLILFPLISYYYIREGFEFYKDQMEELSPKADLNDILPHLDTLHADMLEIWHLACAGCSHEEKKESYSQFLEFSDDFKGKENMFFRSISTSNDSLYFVENPLLERVAWSFHHTESLPLNLTINSISYTLGSNPHFIIIDKDGQIRNVYSAAIKGDIGRLITHTAMLMPKSGRKTVDILRESEM